MAEITSPDDPGERLIACRNPFLAAEQARTRVELLQATERELDRIVAATVRKKCRLTGEVEIGLKVGKVLNHYGEWHMREKLAPLLFDEDDWEAARSEQVSTWQVTEKEK